MKKLKGPAANKEERLRIDGRLLEKFKLENGSMLDPNDGTILDPRKADTNKANADFNARVLSEIARQTNREKQNNATSPELAAEVDAAIKAWHDRKDKGSREEALNQLEELIRKLRSGEQKERRQ